MNPYGNSRDRSAVNGAIGDAEKRLQTKEGRATRATELRAFAAYYEHNGDKAEAKRYRQQAAELEARQ